MDATLPIYLRERFRWFVAPSQTPAGDFVLYWMHHAVRGHENPALDVAKWYANHLKVPLLVYHALSEEYPFASDRHHTFMIQGARDVQREMQESGVRYAFHLQRENSRGPHLRDLTRRAALVITDEMPLTPIIGWLERLRATTGKPIASVDTTCIVPTLLLDKAYTRAFEFRSAIQDELQRRISNPYDSAVEACDAYDGPLPFDPISLQDMDLRLLVGQCRIDHMVAPVGDTPGGSRAGYDRWETFKRVGLKSYANRRNNAADLHGVSRLSAYLHYGMVSPFRVVRESFALGAEKFIDELVVWRELAFNFCFHHHDVINSLHAIPAWAQATLSKHETDKRELDLSWEAFSRGKSQSELWDACQRSLLKHGELHNNLRMTWGKAILQWCNSVDRALHTAIDVNHRYALDGRDPSSYGGLLWCFGQFDRPFKPEEPIYGTVRPRSVDEHARRIDLKKYLRVVDRSVCENTPKVAIVGAGMAGLVAARTLADHGISVKVFDKSHGVGGRMATRRTSSGLTFDHGAQYFTARDPRFARFVHAWVHEGIVQPWHGRLVELRNGKVVAEKDNTARYVATPGMNAIAKKLASELDVTLGCSVQRIDAGAEKDSDTWQLVDSAGIMHGPFDVVILNCPPLQSGPLLRPYSPVAEKIAKIEMLPCWASMIEIEFPTTLDFDAAFVDQSPLSWICRNDTKPGRPHSEKACWVLHASSQWSKDHLEDDAIEVERQLHAAMRDAIGLADAKFISHGTHRWRYAVPESVLDEPCLWDSATRLGACGDWCGGPRVEGAFLSGAAMAGAVLRHWTIDRPVRQADVDPAMLF